MTKHDAEVEVGQAAGVFAAVERALAENRYEPKRIRYDRVTLEHDEDELVVREAGGGEVVRRLDLVDNDDVFHLARAVYTANAVEVRR